jgi:hypothetical protein
VRADVDLTTYLDSGRPEETGVRLTLQWEVEPAIADQNHVCQLFAAGTRLRLLNAQNRIRLPGARAKKRHDQEGMT